MMPIVAERGMSLVACYVEGDVFDVDGGPLEPTVQLGLPWHTNADHHRIALEGQ